MNMTTSTHRCDFVLSRFKETFSMKDLESAIQDAVGKTASVKLFVYDKDTSQESTWKLLPNLGREHLAWIEHILQTWESPPEYYAFIHPCGAGIDQRPDKFQIVLSLAKDLSEMIIEGRSYGPIIPASDEKANCWDPNFFLNSHWTGSTLENKEEVKRQTYTLSGFTDMGVWWNTTTCIDDFPSQRSCYGMCISSKEQIQSWGIDFWKKLREQVIVGGVNGEISHFLERSMYTLAQGRNDCLKTLKKRACVNEEINCSDRAGIRWWFIDYGFF